MRVGISLILCLLLFLPGTGLNDCFGATNPDALVNPATVSSGALTEANTIHEQHPGTLDLFVMSHCPFAQMAESDILRYLAQTTAWDRIALEIHYIFYKQSLDGQNMFTALHGEGEVRENLVQMVFRDDFPSVYHDYLQLRAGNNDRRWEELAGEIGMTEEDLEYIDLRMKEDGDQLIAAEYEYVAGGRHVLDGSPTILWRNEKVRDFRQIEALHGFQRTAGIGSDVLSGIDAVEPPTGMANPAAVYCRELGYGYRLMSLAEGEYGVCILPDGECEEWDFLIGRCGREHSYCALNGYDLETREDGKDSLSREYAVCMKNGEEVGKVSELISLDWLSKGKQVLDAKDVQASAVPPKTENAATVTEDHFDWRDHNGHDWMTGVRNQGVCGSCWAFSATGVVEAQYNIDLNDPDLDIDLSEQYLVSDCFAYGNISNCCGGWKHRALEFISTDGIPDESCLPYVDGSGCSCGASTCDSNCLYNDPDIGRCSDCVCSDRCADWETRLYGLKNYVKITENIKRHLIDHGPLAISMGYGVVYGGHFDENGVYRCEQETGTNHAVSIVGFDDVEQYWIVKNSWGTGWHDGGYFKLGYGECRGEEFVYYTEAVNSHTVSTNLTCLPASGSVPFSTTMTVMMTNLFTDQIRRFAGHVDVTLANGQHYPNWLAGSTNVGPDDSFITSWPQVIPELSTVIGDNHFSLVAEDVTPAPYNQPPYPPSGDTDTDRCIVRGIDPQAYP